MNRTDGKLTAFVDYQCSALLIDNPALARGLPRWHDGVARVCEKPAHIESPCSRGVSAVRVFALADAAFRAPPNSHGRALVML